MFQPEKYGRNSISTIEVFSNTNSEIFVALDQHQDGGLMSVLELEGWKLKGNWFTVKYTKPQGGEYKLDKIWSKKLFGGQTLTFQTTVENMIFAIFAVEGWCLYGILRTIPVPLNAR